MTVGRQEVSRTIEGGDEDDWSFDCGVAISVYQNSGGTNNQWESFERQKRWFGRPAIKVGHVLLSAGVVQVADKVLL